VVPAVGTIRAWRGHLTRAEKAGDTTRAADYRARIRDAAEAQRRATELRSARARVSGIRRAVRARDVTRLRKSTTAVATAVRLATVRPRGAARGEPGVRTVAVSRVHYSGHSFAGWLQYGHGGFLTRLVGHVPFGPGRPAESYNDPIPSQDYDWMRASTVMRESGQDPDVWAQVVQIYWDCDDGGADVEGEADYPEDDE